MKIRKGEINEQANHLDILLKLDQNYKDIGSQLAEKRRLLDAEYANYKNADKGLVQNDAASPLPQFNDAVSPLPQFNDKSPIDLRPTPKEAEVKQPVNFFEQNLRDIEEKYQKERKALLEQRQKAEVKELPPNPRTLPEPQEAKISPKNPHTLPMPQEAKVPTNPPAPPESQKATVPPLHPNQAKIDRKKAHLEKLMFQKEHCRTGKRGRAKQRSLANQISAHQKELAHLKK